MAGKHAHDGTVAVGELAEGQVLDGVAFRSKGRVFVVSTRSVPDSSKVLVIVRALNGDTSEHYFDAEAELTLWY